MPRYDPALSHFDLNSKRGSQGELFIADLRKALAENSATIEVKTDAWFVKSKRLYVEHECRGRDGTWRPSGIETTKARLWAFVMGAHPGALIVETEWLRRACRLSLEISPKNWTECIYGQNPTKGVYVYIEHLIAMRDKALDEH